MDRESLDLALLLQDRPACRRAIEPARPGSTIQCDIAAEVFDLLKCFEAFHDLIPID